MPKKIVTVKLKKIPTSMITPAQRNAKLQNGKITTKPKALYG